MCGFIGRVQFKEESFTPIGLEKPLSSMSHRGPDEQKIEIGDFWEFGFCRLSILDLSSDGSQPMYSENKNSILLFNGEIYNYQYLRQKLNKMNVFMKSSGDTEVLLNWINIFGVEGINDINGMFAFAYLNIKNRRLILARDRVGEKPLIYKVNNNSIIFSSELKSLVKFSNLKNNIDKIALNQYFCYGYIPAPKTIFENINKLEPASYLNINLDTKNSLVPKKYWQVKYKPNLSYSFSDWVDSTEELLNNSVKLRLSSDVKLGVFLSGGIDSNLISYFAKKNNTKNKLTAFTMGFSEQNYDETSLAKLSASYLKINHEVDYYPTENISNIFKNLVNFYDEPFSDASSISMYLLAKNASKLGKVFLSGDGGDELFCGYKRYLTVNKHNWIDYIPKYIRKIIIKNNKLNSKYLRFSLDSFERKMFHYFPYYKDFNNYLIINKSHRVAHDDIGMGINKFINDNETSLIPSMQLYDLNYYLSNDIMTKVDRASMANSIEVRSPFLDHRLIEHAFKIPSHHNIEKSKGKRILYEISKKYLHQDILNHKKQGFGTPIQNWFKKEKKYIYNEYLNSSHTINRGIYDMNHLKLVSEEFIKSKNDSIYKNNFIWKFIFFEEWCRQFMD